MPLYIKNGDNIETLIKNGHIIDPARHMSYKADILVENGIISV